MHLELQQLIKDHPDLEERLNNLPLKVFSGKENIRPGCKAVFFCYALPALDMVERKGERCGEWSTEDGQTQWYLYDIEKQEITSDATEIVDFIRSKPDTKRRCRIERSSLKDIREKIEKHIKNSYLKKVQAPQGIRPILKAWMEFN